MLALHMPMQMVSITLLITVILLEEPLRMLLHVMPGSL